MRKTREEKAITLIALIITIVVLLILAVVAINSVTGDGIIQHAVNAKTQYENAQAKEQDMISYYETYLQTEGKAGKWVQEGATLKTTNADGTITKVKIGDYVNYIEGTHTHTPDVSKGAGTVQNGGNETEGYTLTTNQLETENLTWRVLGINKKGELELISADPTTQTLFLANDDGYVNAEENLNNFCNDLYGKGTNSKGQKVATGARSLSVDDINKLTKYDPKSDTSYGVEWQYRFSGASTKVQYSTDGGTTWADTSKTTFRLPNEETAISSTNPDIRKVEYTYYDYTISSNLTADDGFTADEATSISNMICIGTTSSNITQWLASRCVGCTSDGAAFGMRAVNNGSMGIAGLFRSYGNFDYRSFCVRPVVSLSSQVSLTGSGNDLGSSSNMWNISL